MSRITDTERGARLALRQAITELDRYDDQGDLYRRPLAAGDAEIWLQIGEAAIEQLDECQALSVAQRGAYAW